MAKAGGFLLIAAGLAAAAYAAAPLNDTSDPELPQEIGMVSTAPVVSPSRPAPASSSQPAFRQVQAPLPAAAAEPVIPPFSAPVVVRLAQRPGSEPASAPVAKASPVPRDRDGLARELQKELKRVGCYEGELNGTWTPTTRAAMKAFTDRVNATLPVDEPDPILFTMVQGQRDKVCGKPCPPGQGVSQDGRCLPNAILVQAARKGAPPVPATTVAKAPAEKPAAVAITGWTTTSTVAAATPAGPPPEGRMALAGPAAEAPPTPPPAAAKPAPAPPVARTASPPAPRVSASQGAGRSWANSVLRNSMSPN